MTWTGAAFAPLARPIRGVVPALLRSQVPKAPGPPPPFSSSPLLRSTICKDDGLDALASYCGVSHEQVSSITNAAMDGKITLEQALDQRLQLLDPTPFKLQGYLHTCKPVGERITCPLRIPPLPRASARPPSPRRAPPFVPRSPFSKTGSTLVPWSLSPPSTPGA